MEDSSSQAPQTKSEDTVEHSGPEQQRAAPPAPDPTTAEPDESDASNPADGRSLRAHKAARSASPAPLGPSGAGQASSTRAPDPGSGRSLRDAVSAAESRARRPFPGRAR